MRQLRPRRTITDLQTRLRAEPRARLGTFVAVFGLLSALVLLLSPPAVVTYEAGVVADRVVRATHSVSFHSEVLTEAEREQAAAAITRQFTRDPAITAREASELGTATTAISKARADDDLLPSEKAAVISAIPETPLSPAVAQQVVGLPAAEWEAVARELERLLATLYSSGIREEQVETARADVPKVLPSGWSEAQKIVAADILRAHLEANEIHDPVATAGARARARAAVGPVQVRVAAGEVVVREGQVVAPQDVEKLRALGLDRKSVV